MKVLWFSPVKVENEENVMGSGGWVNCLAKHLSENANIKLHVAFMSDCKEIRKNEFGNITTYHIPSEKYATKFIEKAVRRVNNFLNLELDKNIVNKYLQIIKAINPDIIQLFGSEHDYGLILPETNIPAIIHIQCVYHIYHHKWYSGISKDDVKKYSSFKAKVLRGTLNHQYSQRYKKVKREKLYYKNCDYFMGRTDWDRRSIKILAPHAKYYHCDEMMREEFFQQKWNSEPDGKNIILITTIGEAIYKGLETIVEAAEILEQNLKYKIKWYIAGLSNKSEIVKICQNKYKNRFSENIFLLGRINSSEMIEKMSEADIYIHPSHIENSSNSLCEAMVFGMPIITTASGGTPSLITDKNEGILIQDGDPWSMAGAILEMYEDPDMAEKYGSNASQIALKRHSPEKIIPNLINIYNEILGNEKGN